MIAAHKRYRIHTTGKEMIMSNEQNTVAFTGPDEDRSTIIAALRFWQQEGMCDPALRSDEMQDLATNGDALTSLAADDIDTLIEQLNFARWPPLSFF